MEEKAVLFGEAIMGSLIWGSESAVAYNSFYLPSLGHGMCAAELGHIQYGYHTGQLMRMIIEYTQLECGTMYNILEQDYDRFSNCIIKKLDNINMATFTQL
jgi:hypothetical protein